MAGEAANLSALERLIREGSDQDVQRFFLLLRPPELADVLEHIPDEDRVRVLRLMNAPLRSEVLIEVEEGEREEILEDLSAREIAEIVHESMSDDAADIIGALPPEKQEDTLERLEREEREELKELLQYGEETAGGIMQTELVTVRSDRNVEQAIAAVRSADLEKVGEIHELFVVDADGRLLGTVSPADLLHEEPGRSVRAVLDADPVRVPVTMDQEQIAEKVREHDLATIPVVDEQGVLVGQILHDDIVDVIEEEATEDIAKLAGADPDEVYHDEIWKAVRSRIGWLLPGFIGGLLVAVMLARVEEELRNSPTLALYLVVIIGMAGAVGTQNAALTVRSLALGRLEFSRTGRVVRRHLLIGLALGVVFGALLFGFVYYKTGAVPPSLTLGLTILCVMTFGALLGVLVPLLLARLGADPAVAASPFITTANDVAGAGIAIWLGRLLGLL